MVVCFAIEGFEVLPSEWSSPLNLILEDRIKKSRWVVVAVLVFEMVVLVVIVADVVIVIGIMAVIVTWCARVPVVVSIVIIV